MNIFRRKRRRPSLPYFDNMLFFCVLCSCFKYGFGFIFIFNVVSKYFSVENLVRLVSAIELFHQLQPFCTTTFITIISSSSIIMETIANGDSS